MPTASLYETEAWQGVAHHEAGHAIMADILGVQTTAVLVKSAESGVVWTRNSDRVSPHDRGAIQVAGAICQQRFLDSGNWRDMLSAGDIKNLHESFSRLGISEQYFDTFVDRCAKIAKAHLFRPDAWRNVEQVVDLLKKHGGKIRITSGTNALYETAAPKPVPKPSTIESAAGRLARRAAELWADEENYP